MTPSPRRAAKVDAILDAAMTEFVTQGYAATSLDRIASGAGVSKATIHSYFQYKEVLFAALVERMATEVKMAEVLVGSYPDVLSLLRAVAVAILYKDEKSLHLRDLIRLIIGESGRFPELAKIFVQRLCMPMMQTLRGAFQQVPELADLDTEILARSFLGSIIFFDLLQDTLHGQAVMPMDRDYFMNTLLETIAVWIKPS
ncbi:TetR family transcriptional regulator [Gloeomargarita lithophora Alchichica-D10]|uniref:TetR family transcriptional regulator n=1 Tax=Gloeomargarita lithophora Alchichica-D10 TaxID=1188229 RepID=A0A1J0AC28_9CYAN|nr:TetR/AcrR family transcriptional regulator [Gloeomargarita lithophora]APB33477.1 TetR family transcriptional regulator [Gloeomargarita lithophora Alchichica-D10]